ncbi:MULTISPECIES: DUF1656 domain-containing protein [unclassified Chelatococcus]|uniref:DUF1656 domain-containing protein n=1 Tax=unclassified Chelatococcus TaxID=2638111 RepID=UPI0020BF8187|nr:MULTISPECIES: DUF1656 domain-containing protein [unclassified Chelatococcus]MCO5074304.1 DUF1656 domain-containing protein [Chelatococcus sp.]CAH1652101.1 conserved hypothetical protein [Hyphomicrobiales bacterium]CAH1693656.1 conserved hypothetical protein [Hyphomicrobiales bacterium]
MLSMSTAAFYTPEAFGFYLPPFMIWAVFALLPFLALRWLLGVAGFYRLIWHRPLFDAALYVIMLGMIILGLPAVAGGEG